MLTYFIALFLALINPVPNYPNSSTSNEQVTIMDDTGDTGGETGTIPPKPPTKP